jgi:hypothetical protein
VRKLSLPNPRLRKRKNKEILNTLKLFKNYEPKEDKLTRHKEL